jgi:FkbM family methyltransferase
MLFNPEELLQYLNASTVTGIVHVGAHTCEELAYYRNVLRVGDDKIFWVEANPDLVARAKTYLPSSIILQGLCAEQAGQQVDFTITRNLHDGNAASSSLLPLGTHKQHHPQVVVDRVVKATTTTVDDLLAPFEASREANMMNLDVQGAELMVLKGALNTLKGIKYIYAEVNEEHLYEGCALMSEIDEWLAPFGFKRVETRMTQYRWGDALYVRE